MKLIHLSDLHLGKRVNEFSMVEDQKYILWEILGIIDEEKPDGILLAGDLYDRPIPSAEAVQLFETVGFTSYGELYEKNGKQWLPMQLQAGSIHKCCNCGH